MSASWLHMETNTSLTRHMPHRQSVVDVSRHRRSTHAGQSTLTSAVDAEAAVGHPDGAEAHGAKVTAEPIRVGQSLPPPESLGHALAVKASSLPPGGVGPSSAAWTVRKQPCGHAGEVVLVEPYSV